ncbi:hypothetical protein I5R16_00370 [Serratia marcescens]|nr:hypothetical protein [Serratia marcescens]MBH3125309.1 hypothetical protein [Serratia marcescens]PIN57256.1 hypothetical protein CUB91_01670 [Serratia marcescens]
MPAKKRPSTKKTLIAPSDKPSAVSRRTKNQLYAQVGIKEQKVFLGKDALDKLRFLLRFQYSHEDDVDDRDPLLLGDVLSYCINACYNLKFVKAARTSYAPKAMTAAKTPQGQRLYRYHQMAKTNDAFELLKTFNACDKRGKPYFPHTDDVAAHFDWGDEFGEMLDAEESEDGENEDEDRWLAHEIQKLRDAKAVRECIKKWNEEAFPTKDEQPVSLDKVGVTPKLKKPKVKKLSGDLPDDEYPDF